MPRLCTISFLILATWSLPEASAQDAPDRSFRLLELARERFPNDWTDADSTFFKAVGNGHVTIYGDGTLPDEQDKDPKRVLRANRIRWLCTDREAQREVLSQQGVVILGARIEGELVLANADVPFLLVIAKSRLDDGLRIDRAHLFALFLDGSHMGSLHGDSVRIDHDIHLKHGFEAEGEVRLLGAKIGGVLDCSGGSFKNPGAEALNADGIEVAGSAFLNKKFQAEGEVRLLVARIGGNLDCTGGSFKNPGAVALGADGIKVAGAVMLKEKFQAEGKVRLVGATIGGGLYCGGGSFKNPGAVALSADGIKVAEAVMLNEKFQAEGTVGLVGATIGGNLICRGGSFKNPGAHALSVDGIEVGGSVFLDEEFEAEGAVGLVGARIGGTLVWRRVTRPEVLKNWDCSLDLSDARVGGLVDDELSWPPTIQLDGFEYSKIHRGAPFKTAKRLDWLSRHGQDERFLPQPYRQLARVLGEMGHGKEAREILMAMEEKRAEQMTWDRRTWHFVLGWTIGYGYAPWRAGVWMIGFVVVGAVVFGTARIRNLMSQTTKQDEYCPGFNAFVYSLDSFAPLIDLRQARHWLPEGRFLRGWLWFHTILGWVLTTLFVVGITGVIR